MRSILYNSFLFILVLVSSCKNDLKLAAPYKDVPYVHAIITPQENMQMIRINKAIQGDGNGKEMAQIPDSVNYKPGELEVMLERFENGVKTTASSSTGNMEIIFRDTLINTKPGMFTTIQRVYITNEKLYNTGEYKLSIKNKTNGHIYTATSAMLDSVPLSVYGPFSPPFYPVPYTTSVNAAHYVNYSGVNNDFMIKTSPVKGAALHDLTIRMHYYDSLSTGEKEYHFLDFPFPTQALYMKQADGKFSFSFTGHQFYSYLRDRLEEVVDPPNLIGRKMYKADFIAFAGSFEYEEFMKFSAPSQTYEPQKILFSNFKNREALGIFTIRTKTHVSKGIANKFIDEFSTNMYTCKYHFFTSQLVLLGCQ